MAGSSRQAAIARCSSAPSRSSITSTPTTSLSWNTSPQRIASRIAGASEAGPIVAFFSVSTTSYPFMLLLNVAVFAISGALGASFLLQTLHRLSVARTLPPPTEAEEHVGEEKGERPPGALEETTDLGLSRHVRLIFRCWVILFGLVGAQMGWVLRPFIGAPDRPFAWFRPRESSFFEAVWHAFMGLIS